MLADPNYLAAKAVHPHLLFNSANRSAVSHYVQTHDRALWREMTKRAETGMASSYWKDPAPWPQKPRDFPDRGGLNGAARSIASAAFAWQMTGDRSWTNNLTINFDHMVDCFMDAGNFGKQGFETDYGNSGGDNTWICSIAYCYDWLYPILTTQERNNALRAMDRVIRLNLYNYFWVTPVDSKISAFPGGHYDATSAYPPPYRVSWGSSAKVGSSHAAQCGRYVDCRARVFWRRLPEQRVAGLPGELFL